jgi:hypothetical protein
MSRHEPQPGPLLRLLTLAVVIGALLRRRPAPGLPAGVDPEDLAAGYEHSDMNPAVIAAGAMGLLLMLTVALVLVTLLEQAMVGVPFTISRPVDLIGGLQAASAPRPPAPALEAQPGQTLNRYRAIEESRLNSYGWVDRASGVIRIPIDRAIDLTAQRGLPTRAASATPPQDNGTTSPSDASSGRVEEAYP